MEQVQTETACKESQKDIPAQVEKEPKVEPIDDNAPEQMDTIDKAIADKAVKEEGYESSDIELSSDEESDSSSSSDEDDEGDKDEGGNNNKEKMMMDYDEDEDIAPDGIVKTAHEIVDVVVEKPHFEFTPNTEVIYAGNIYQIIDNVVVIHCRPGAEHSTLDQGSLLVYQDREILGEVFETFGPVSRPYYSVRFNNVSEIDTTICKVGDPIFYVPSYVKTQIVQTEELKKIKGYDASNMYDEELAEEDMEFSDDEKELEYKRKRNREKKTRNAQRNGNSHLGNFAPQKRARALPNDFDSALADYESIQAPLPPRQQQSYADLNEGYTPQLWPLQPPVHQQMIPPQANAYQTPADLVSNLFNTTGNPPNQYNRPPQALPQQQHQNQHYQQPQQPNQQQPIQNQNSKKSFRSIFADPPPPSSS
ncbi:NAF1-domain-containing protein [Backusella circina FSU 941]|nr:NAF1-domain-containing protein [Backusella circina FSU 941]